MAYERSCLRYAHTVGYTALTYTENGEQIVTCGSDGDLRIWSGIEDDDPTSHCLGEFVICIAQIGDKLLASTDHNTVQQYTFPDRDPDGTLMRFTALVTCIWADKEYIVAGSEDTNVKVMKRSEGNPTTDLTISGHTGPILSMDVCKTKNLLATAAGDGQLKIWNLENGNEIKTITAELGKINSFERAEQFVTPTFQPSNGNYLAYAKGKEVLVLNTTNWETEFTLSDGEIKADYTCCHFSSDGKFIAAGTTTGEISIFDIATKKTIIAEMPAESHVITCIKWHPKNNNELAYTDGTGQLGTLFRSGKNFLIATAAENEEEMDLGDIQFNEDDDDTDGGNDGANFKDNMDKFGNDDDDDDDDNDDDGDGDGVSLEKLKAKVTKSVMENFKTSIDIDDDDNTRGSLGSHSVASKSLDGHHKLLPQSERQFVKTFAQQTAFQPTATPIHLEHRYLVWNSVGIVTSHEDNSDGAIDVEFHDANVHHSLHIPNSQQHNIGSLSKNVLALSSVGGTKIVCIALDPSGNKEWSVQLPDCESVEVIAATDKLVGVATSMHFLRIFTVMGTQREVITLPGQVVTMAGHEEQLLVCFHSSPASEKQQHLAAMLIKTRGFKLTAQQLNLPLTPGRQITWLGFTDCGSPAFADHMGLVQLFSKKSNCWYPICDTMKRSQNVCNNYFIIAILESVQLIQAVLCRACTYPMTNPRPMLQELELQLPLADLDANKSELEDKLLRATILQVENSEKIIKETGMRLFAETCSSEFELRAIELIETMANSDLLALAIKYVTKAGRIHLLNALNELRPKLEKAKLDDNDVNQMKDISLAGLQTWMSTSNTNTPTSTSIKLAPKPMKIHATSSKRPPFKRSTNLTTSSSSSITTPTSDIDSQSSSVDLLKSSEIQTNSLLADTQENVNQTNFDSSESTTANRNSVNPFASAKRKISEIDGAKNFLTTGKIKFAKN